MGTATSTRAFWYNHKWVWLHVSRCRFVLQLLAIGYQPDSANSELELAYCQLCVDMVNCLLHLLGTESLFRASHSDELIYSSGGPYILEITTRFWPLARRYAASHTYSFWEF